MQLTKANKLMAKANVQNPTLEDLAKYLGFLLGYEGKVGGWVYNNNHKVIAQGWTAVGNYFTRLGWIKIGKSPDFYNEQHIEWGIVYKSAN